MEKQPMAYPLTSQEGSWQDSTLAELASQQSIRPIQSLEEILGMGKALWKDEEEFESFVQGIYQRRKEDRERGAWTP
jgi:hypothetical protein